MSERLDEIMERLAKATPGPWQWRKCDKKSNTWGWGWRLVAPHSGMLYVMDFERDGMQGAQPRFAERTQDANGRWDGGILSTFEQAGERPLPDADLIAHAPNDIADMAPVVAAALKRRDARRALTEWWRVNDPDKDGLACIASEAELDAVEDALYEAQEAEDIACDAFDTAQPADHAHAERLRLERAVVEAAKARHHAMNAESTDESFIAFERCDDQFNIATDALLAFEAQGGPTE